MDNDERPQLPVLSTQQVSHPVVIDRTVLCSPHDLIAIVTHFHDVVVYRLNGQVAFTIKNPEANPYDDDHSGLPKTTCLEWSPSGRSLAIAWSDGTWNIYEAEKGEIIFKDAVSSTPDDDSPTYVVNFNWHEHKTTVPSLPSDRQHNAERREIPQPDLPRAITLHDVTKILPKLSALPSHGLRSGADGAKFANQQATDAMFGSIDSEMGGDEVDLLIVQASDGTIRIMLGGTSHVGTIEGRRKTSPCHTLCIPEQSTLGTFSQRTDTDIEAELLTLPLSELNSALLHGLAHSTSQLSALALYLQRSIHCITHDFTTGVTYPDRLVKNVTMSMEDREDSSTNLTSALTHLALTGQFHPDVLEWLVDIVKDTGLKRWDTSISGMYAAIQTHLHLHAIPALNRVSIAASRIRGFARLYQGSRQFAPDEALFSNILVKCDALQLAVRAMLHTCITEWSTWRAFAKWLKMQIDIGTAIPGTKSAAEAEERECTSIDIHKVLRYVETVLTSGSALKPWILSDSTTASTFVDKARKSTQAGANGTGHHPHIETLQSLVTEVHESIQSSLHSITDWQGRLFMKPTLWKSEILGRGRLSSLTRIASPEAARGRAHMIFMALLDPESFGMTVCCVKDTEVQSSSKRSTLSEQLTGVVEYDKVIDAKFFHHKRQLVVLRSQPLDSAAVGDNVPVELGVHKLQDGGFNPLHRFDTTQFKPSQVFVGGRQDKEFCVVFDETFSRWQVLDLKTTTDRY